MTHRLFITITLLTLTVLSAGATHAQIPANPALFGERIKQVNAAFPLIDRVVLVPDAATYLDELTKWSPLGRWPVLFEDSKLAPMFIRRFQPTEVIRRDPVGRALPNDDASMRRLLEGVVVNTWGGDPNAHSIRAAFDRQKFEPQGVVVASTTDPAWTAAVALAAGRGQPLAWMDDSFGRVVNTLNEQDTLRLMDRVKSVVMAQGYPHAKMGDAIDAITLCRTLAGRVKFTVRGKSEPCAMTDLVGRHADGRRYAITGWIFGDETRCAYMAMCSLFLPCDNALLFNTYELGGSFGAYGMTEAAASLKASGFTADVMNGPRASLRAWHAMLAGGVSRDLILVNTMGNADFFRMSDGVNARPDDVPVLNHPAAVHFIHSWSLLAPTSLGTVGGQWLDAGAYAYVGSVHEPYLGAFVPPKSLVARWMNPAPFLFASRQFTGQFSNPWKVNTIGDPLMLCVTPGHDGRKRVSMKADYGTNLNEDVKRILRNVQTDASGKTHAEAIAMLNLIGRDDIAIQIWTHARQTGVEARSATHALGPLFRAQERSEFMHAWSFAARDALAVDMLWHLMWPTIGSNSSDDTLLALASSIRRPLSYVDLRRLAPHLVSRLGSAFFRKRVQTELEVAPRESIKKPLRKLLEEF